jgi:4-amino-4-deoxychorismate lyase
MSAPPSFQLFTSMRYDTILLKSSDNSRPDLNFVTPSPFYMLAYHRDRMVEAAQHFDFDAVTAALSDGPALHKELLDRVKAWQTQEGAQDGPLKLRISFDKAGQMTVDFLSIPAVPLSTLYPKSFDPMLLQSPILQNNPLSPHPSQAAPCNLDLTPLHQQATKTPMTLPHRPSGLSV